MSQEQHLLAFGLSREEMACPCCGHLVADPELLSAWARFRTKLGRPVTIASGYRCADHNAKVGGAHASQHRQGKALDIVCDAVELESEWIYRLLLESGFRGIGHGEGIFHIDVREDAYFWLYVPDGQEDDPGLTRIYQKLKEKNA